MKLSPWIRRPAIIAAVAVVAGSAGAAVAVAVTPSNPVYMACVATSAPRSLYNVRENPGSPPTCRSGDFRISWNQTGPQGVRGVAGPTGPTGPAGPSGPPGGLSDVTTVTQQETVSAGFLKEATAVCPDGYQVTGGGFQVPNSLVSVTISEPIVDQLYTPARNAWDVIVKDNDSIDLPFTAYAQCAP